LNPLPLSIALLLGLLLSGDPIHPRLVDRLDLRDPEFLTLCRRHG
jgi:hypothetical protein